MPPKPVKFGAELEGDDVLPSIRNKKKKNKKKSNVLGLDEPLKVIGGSANMIPGNEVRDFKLEDMSQEVIEHHTEINN